jgi:magnesium transporter
MADSTSISARPWEDLEEIIRSGNAEAVAMFLQLLPAEDTAYTIAQLTPDDQTKMLAMLSEERPDFAADLMEHFADEHAADMIEELEPHHAAAIVEEMDSDEQADILGELDEDDLEAILEKMDPEEAQDARERLEYPHDTAGGLMINEVITYDADMTIDDVLADLRVHGEEYTDHEIRYVYVVDKGEHLLGVLSMRRLPFMPHARTLRSLMIDGPTSVPLDAPLDALEDLFDHVDFSAIPVVDAGGVLHGVVQRAALQEALSERAAQTLMKFGGIIGGEELRSMPLTNRWLRRLAFLGPNILLSYVAVTIVAFYEPTIEKLTVLAVFLPMLANLSGAAGNQAVAVSIRELSLGLVKPGDAWRVMRKEAWIGLFNGLAIGGVLAAIVLLTRSESAMIPLIIGAAYTINSVLSVLLGGALPLVLKAMKVDPAMMSSPILTTMTDMGAFFLTLSFAAVYLMTVS